MDEQASITAMVASYESYLATATDLQPSTRWRYAYQVKRFAAKVGDRSLSDCTPQALLACNAALHDAGAHHSTSAKKHAALESFFRYLERLQEDWQAARLPRVLDRLEVPDDPAPGLGPRNRAMLHFFWATGVRKAELINLKLTGCDLSKRRAKGIKIGRSSLKKRAAMT